MNTLFYSHNLFSLIYLCIKIAYLPSIGKRQMQTKYNDSSNEIHKHSVNVVVVAYDDLNAF